MPPVSGDRIAAVARTPIPANGSRRLGSGSENGITTSQRLRRFDGDAVPPQQLKHNEEDYPHDTDKLGGPDILVKVCFRLGPMTIKSLGESLDPNARYAVQWACGRSGQWDPSNQGTTDPAQFVDGQLECGPQGWQAFVAENIPYPCDRQQLRLTLIQLPPGPPLGSGQQPAGRELTMLKLRLHNFPLRPRASQLALKWGPSRNPSRVTLDVKIQLKQTHPPTLTEQSLKLQAQERQRGGYSSGSAQARDPQLATSRSQPLNMPTPSEIHGWDGSEINRYQAGSDFARAEELEANQQNDLKELIHQERRLEAEFEDMRRRYRNDQQRIKEGDRRLDELKQEIARLREQGDTSHPRNHGPPARRRQRDVQGWQRREPEPQQQEQRHRSCAGDPGSAGFCNCAFQ